MGPRILSVTPSPTTELPDVITIEDSDENNGNDKENILIDEEEIDSSSFIWKSAFKPISAENNVINKKQSYKSNSSVVHAALDASSKEKKHQKPIKRRIKAVKDMTEEEIKKELSEIDLRRNQLLTALASFEKKKEEEKEERKSKNHPKTPQRRMSMFGRSPAAREEDTERDNRRPSIFKNDLQSPQRSTPIIDEFDSPQSAKKVIITAKRRYPLPEKVSNNEMNKENVYEFSQNTSSQASSSSKCPTLPAKKLSFSPRRRMSMVPTKSPFKRNDSQQSSRIQINSDGDMVQIFDKSNIEEEQLAEETGAVVAAAAANSQTLNEVVQRTVEIPYSKEYDPIKTVQPHRVSLIMQEIRDQFKHMYYQPDLPDNDVKVPFRKMVTDNVFYLFEIPGDKVDSLKSKIKSLGGNVTNRLYKATRLLFCPTNRKMSSESLFLFATAAIGGRYLLPACYISECLDQNKFVDVADYSSNDYYDSKVDLDSLTLAAIKMSNSYRNRYFNNKYPRFHRANVLLAVSRSQDEDVKLLLQILGAYVQRCYDGKKFLKNPLYTLCVTDGSVPLHDDTKLIPYTSPDNIREMLWNTLNKFE